jgi:hypothetical protein
MSHPSAQPENGANGQDATNACTTAPFPCPLPVGPRRQQGITAEQCCTLEEAGCPLAHPAQERLCFETLLANLSATFVSVPANKNAAGAMLFFQTDEEVNCRVRPRTKG